MILHKIQSSKGVQIYKIVNVAFKFKKIKIRSKSKIQKNMNLLKDQIYSNNNRNLKYSQYVEAGDDDEASTDSKQNKTGYEKRTETVQSHQHSYTKAFSNFLNKSRQNFSHFDHFYQPPCQLPTQNIKNKNQFSFQQCMQIEQDQHEEQVVMQEQISSSQQEQQLQIKNNYASIFDHYINSSAIYDEKTKEKEPVKEMPKKKHKIEKKIKKKSTKNQTKMIKSSLNYKEKADKRNSFKYRMNIPSVANVIFVLHGQQQSKRQQQKDNDAIIPSVVDKKDEFKLLIQKRQKLSKRKIIYLQ